QRLRLPLFQWTIYDSAKSDSIRWALDNALSVEPGHWPSQQNRGLLALKKGKLYEAEEHLGKAMTLASHKVQTLLSLAAFHLSENAWKEAHEVLSDAALLDSTNWRVHATLGYALLRKKGFQKAIQEFQKAISLGDSTVVTRYYLAECLQNQGHMDEADTIWLRLSHDYPEHLFGKLSALKHKRASSISGSSGSVSVVESPACRWVKPGMTRIMVIGVAGKISKNGMHLTETALKNKLGVSV
ncbi:MAG: tetratricopeptide repeat protein, partial [bacterium]